MEKLQCIETLENELALIHKKSELMQQVDKRALWYLTQYASYQTDEGFYQSFTECINVEIDPDKLNELLKIMTDSSDNINEIVFNHFLFNLDNEKIEKLIELYELINDGDFYGVMDLLGVELFELYPDEYIATAEEFEELADQDFKANGINANAIYWYHKLYNAEGLLMLDIYNDFSELDGDDVIEKILDENTNLIIDYINE